MSLNGGIMLRHDRCGEFEAKILELEKIIKEQEEQLVKYYDRLQAVLEENIILTAELDDTIRKLERALV